MPRAHTSVVISTRLKGTIEKVSCDFDFHQTFLKTLTLRSYQKRWNRHTHPTPSVVILIRLLVAFEAIPPEIYTPPVKYIFKTFHRRYKDFKWGSGSALRLHACTHVF